MLASIPYPPPSPSAVVRLDLAAHPGRVFVVGDLHGMAHSFERLLDGAGFDPALDLVWSLGDLADRGPYSLRCLDLLDEPWFRSVRGNHEQLMLDAEDDYGNWLQWMANGGEWSAGCRWDAPDILARIAALPWAAELTTAAGRIGLVHADVHRTATWPQLLADLEADRGLARETALWSRRSARRAIGGRPPRIVEGIDLVLLGHSIVPASFQWGNIRFLDTGAMVVSESTAALSMLEIHPRLRTWTLPTAGDRDAAHWYNRLTPRLSGILDRARQAYGGQTA